MTTEIQGIISGPYAPGEHPEPNGMWMLVVSTKKGPEEIFTHDFRSAINLAEVLKESTITLTKEE